MGSNSDLYPLSLSICDEILCILVGDKSMRIEDMNAAVTIEAPAADVWRVVGLEFAEIDRWSSGIRKSAGIQDGELAGSCDLSGRSCDAVQERLTYFEEEAMRFGYVMVDPPFFLKEIGNNWQVKAAGDNRGGG